MGTMHFFYWRINRRQGIPYKYDGEGGIWTTLQALNAALGIGTDLADAPYRPEDIV